MSDHEIMAGSLLRNTYEAFAAEQDDQTSAADGARRPGNALQPAPSPAKREQVSAACQSCRQRKVKCDALRPCTTCVKRKLICRSETLEGETHTQASKRKYDEMTRSHGVYTELFLMLAQRSEQDAARILHSIRSGHTPDMILRAMRTEHAALLNPSPRRVAHANFLLSLSHSTGSLRDIVRLATLVLDPAAKVRLPDSEDFLRFRNRPVRLPHLEASLYRSARVGRISPPLSLGDASGLSDRDTVPSGIAFRDSPSDDDAGSEDSPPYEVPATPWTCITTSNAAISHLVSLFLIWINPTWRFVEPDLFVYGMRSESLQSDFCSPFLVNSICAIASLHSEHDVAFTQENRDRITRGQHFHDEALRLWMLEEGRPSITNIQALCILSLESNYRAKDRIGLTLIPSAVQLNNQLHVHGDEQRCAAQGVSKQDFARVRLSAHWTARCTHVIMRIAFMSGTPTEPRVPDLPKIYDIFEDKAELWIGYPLTNEAVPYRPTLYFRERCRLAELFQEMHELIFQKDLQCNATIQDFINAVDHLSAKMQRWYNTLPFELHYIWPMTVAVWELHASYITFLMTLWIVARNRCQKNQDSTDQLFPMSDSEEEVRFRTRISQEKLSSAILLAHKAAQIMADFRSQYGLKINPAWLLQLQAVTASVLILDPKLKEPTTIASPEAQQPEGTIQDSQTAFDEVFRCLLGTGVEVMIARGIARMMYHTALNQKIVLSRATRTMLQVMSNTAWRPSDLSLVNSAFPDFTTTKGHGNSRGLTELLSQWEKLEI